MLMERFILTKYKFDLTDFEVNKLLLDRYKKYYNQRIEGCNSALLYLNNNLVFVKRVGTQVFIVSVLAPSEKVREYWCTFPLKQLSRKIYDLFYKRKYILL